MIERNSELGPDRLLPGEPPDSRWREDADHWVVVYSELVRFLCSSAASRTHVLNRYSRRLAFWRARAEALECRADAEETPLEASQ